MHLFFNSEMKKILKTHEDITNNKNLNFVFPEWVVPSLRTTLYGYCDTLSTEAFKQELSVKNPRQKKAWHDLAVLFREMKEEVDQWRFTHLFNKNRMHIMQESINALEESNVFKRYFAHLWKACLVTVLIAAFAVCVYTAGFWGVIGGAILSFWAGTRASLPDPISAENNLLEHQVSLVAKLSQQLTAYSFFESKKTSGASKSVPQQPSANENEFSFAPGPVNETQPDFYNQLNINVPKSNQNQRDQYITVQGPDNKKHDLSENQSDTAYKYPRF